MERSQVVRGQTLTPTIPGPAPDRHHPPRVKPGVTRLYIQEDAEDGKQNEAA
jgi:hypothetical protein